MTIEQVNNQIRRCSLCPNDKGMKELGWGALNGIMFIGQYPTSINKTGLQETSNFNQYFLELLKPIGISQSEFYFTNLIKIPISNMKKVPKTVIHHCADHLIDEYLAVNPKIVITLGRYAKKFTKIENIENMTHLRSIRYGHITEEQWREYLKKILKGRDLLTRNQIYGRR